MLSISTQQWTGFSSQASGDFLSRLGTLLESLRPGLFVGASPPARQAFCRRMVTEARGQGFETEFEVAVFGVATVLHGAAWYTDPSHPLHASGTRQSVSPLARAHVLLNAIAGPPARPTPARALPRSHATPGRGRVPV